MAALFALGLSVYLYLPLRWPAVNNGQPMSLQQFADKLAGGEARGAFQWDLPLRDGGRLGIAWHKIAGEYGWAGLALAVAGLGVLAWRDLTPRPPSLKGKGVTLGERGGGGGPGGNGLARADLSGGGGYGGNEMALGGPGGGGPAKVAEGLPGAGGGEDLRAYFLLVVAAYAPYFYFALAFNVPDPDFSAFFIPLHLLAAVLMGVGAQALLNLGRADPRPGPGARPVRIQRERLGLAGGRSVEVLVTAPPAPRRRGTPAVVVVLVEFALLPLGSVWRTLPAVDQSKDWERQRLGELMLAQPLKAGATILADSQKIAPLT
jgi:hypothetical protein